MRQRHFVLLVAAVLAGIAGVPVVARAAADPVSFRVVNWNVCGEFTGCPKVDDPAGKVLQVKQLATARQADAVLLQEVCEWQANRVVLELNHRTDTSTTNDTDDRTLAFAPQRQIDIGHGYPGRRTRVCDPARYAAKGGKPALTTADHAFGAAVLVRGTIDEITTFELPAPTQTAYTYAPPLLCGRQMPKDVRVCVTHFTPSASDEGTLRGRQASRVAAALAGYADDRVVVGGDLNSTPGDGVMTPLYGAMRECEQAGTTRGGPPTTSWGTGEGRLDYLFVRSGDSTDQALVTDCDTPALTSVYRQWSDHTPVIGTFLL